MLPSKTSTATGHPSRLQSSAKTIWVARLAVLGVPAPGEGAFRALEVDRGHVAQDEATVFEVLFGQPSLDALLPFEQPIHGGVELVGARLLDSEFLAEGVGRGLA